MVESRGPVSRSDARANRARILAAARQVVADHGADVAIEEIIRKASVGRGTFYRHFDDRNALFVALYDDSLDHLTAVGDDLPPEQRLVAIIRAAAPMQKEVFPFASALNRTAPDHVLREIDRRFEEIIRQPLSAAKRAGLVRPDLDADDIVTLLTMIGGASVFRPGADEPRHESRALRFVLDAIEPRS